MTWWIDRRLLWLRGGHSMEDRSTCLHVHVLSIQFENQGEGLQEVVCEATRSNTINLDSKWEYLFPTVVEENIMWNSGNGCFSFFPLLLHNFVWLKLDETTMSFGLDSLLLWLWVLDTDNLELNQQFSPTHCMYCIFVTLFPDSLCNPCVLFFFAKDVSDK